MPRKNRSEAKRRSRRKFLKGLGAAAASTLVAGRKAEALSFSLSELFQNHFKKFTKEDLEKVLSRLEEEYSKKYKRQVYVKSEPPIPNVLFAYALDLSRCIGCRRCVYGCVEENNQSREPQVHWIKVLRMEKEKGIFVEEAELYYNPDLVPEEGYFYMPVQCHQCRNAPCTKVCPVQATWTETDGIVVVDYNWCIGCRYCMAACPYGARHFNWGEPKVPPEEINPVTHYLGNRPRYVGVVEKCTFCVQRARNGRYPACVEVCPVGARKFGDLNDPDSEIRYIIENKRVYIFKEELNTQPKFFYYFGI
ncbi:MAG: 4Fe-4S dicluster domain-containing protein [Deltaproteobacteria bacterium]|nr:4Fe-4S dicluster domain-containing protein [Deltaproteobacteria bacterium]